MKKSNLMKKFCVFLVAFFFYMPSLLQAQQNDRKLWLSYMDKIARPVLSNLSEDKLKEKMPVILSKRIDNAESRSKVAYLEALGRTLSGIAPWLNLQGGPKDEMQLRDQYRQWSLRAIANAVDSTAKDYMLW